ERLSEAGKETEDPHAVRSPAKLHPADDFPLPEGEVGDTEDQSDRDDHDPHRRPDRARERAPSNGESLLHFSTLPRVRGLRSFFAVRELCAPTRRSDT